METTVVYRKLYHVVIVFGRSKIMDAFWGHVFWLRAFLLRTPRIVLQGLKGLRIWFADLFVAWFEN